MLRGNKGEWSEVYVFLKLLADGKLNGANAKLDAIPEVYYPIIKIIREENNAKKEYIIDKNIKIIDGSTNNEILSVALSTFVTKSKELFNLLKNAKGNSFSFPIIEEFLHSIKVNNLVAAKSKKSDINIVVHDLNTGLKPKLGFSIKSMLGKNSTLFNPGNTTNFIYEIKYLKTAITTINKIEMAPKIANRIKAILELGAEISFIDITSKSLKLNLQLIDSDLSKILAELLLIKYSNNGIATIYNALQQVEKINPLNYDLSLGHPFYEYKIKNFLTDVALGMTPSSI